MRVGFVTTSDTEVLHDDGDLPMHLAAFADAGIDLVLAPWEDGTVDWDSFDLVVVRSPWNYVDRLDEFRTWLEDRRDATNLHNPGPLIEWNMDKRYLTDLAEHGVPIVPTAFAESIEEFRDAVTTTNAAEIVLKPTVSAGSRLTGRFDRDDPGVERLAGEILARGFSVMVQPFARSIDDEGEIGTVFFDGRRSHSFRKGPLLAVNGGLLGGTYREQISAIAAPADAIELAELASSASTEFARGREWIAPGEELLYGRFDIIELDDGTQALLEAELFEPSFFLTVSEGSSQRFVDAVRRRIG